MLNKSNKFDDYIILQNDDATFSADFVENLVSIANRNEKAVIGSVAVDRNSRKIIHCNMLF